MLRRFASSSRLFSYLGLGLILLALICLPTNLRFDIGPETELWHVGAVIALLVGAWSLPSLILGFIESSAPKKTVVVRLLPAVFLANALLTLLFWDAIRFWSDMLIQWVVNFSLFLAPCLIADAIASLYFMNSEDFKNSLKNLKTRILLATALTAVPLIVAGGTLYLWLT